MKMERLLMKKYKKLNISNGFSIIELMVVVVILSLIILGLVSIFSGGTRSWISGQSQLEAQRDARQAIDRMVRELRHAERVISCDAHSVEVYIPPLDGSAGYQVTYSWDGVRYHPIYRNIASGGTNILIDNVLDLKFDNPKSSRINIVWLKIDVDHDEAADITLNTAINLRNF